MTHSECQVIPSATSSTAGVCIDHGVLVYLNDDQWHTVPLSAVVTRRYRTYKTVRVCSSKHTPDTDILTASLLATGETLDTLHGYTLTRRTNGYAEVTLHTD